MAANDTVVLSRDLRRRLPHATEREITALVEYVHTYGFFERVRWRDSAAPQLEYHPDLFAIAPRLFPCPVVPDDASPGARLTVAEQVARWLDGSIVIPTKSPTAIDATPTRPPTEAEQKCLDAEALAHVLAAAEAAYLAAYQGANTADAERSANAAFDAVVRSHAHAQHEREHAAAEAAALAANETTNRALDARREEIMQTLTGDLQTRALERLDGERDAMNAAGLAASKQRRAEFLRRRDEIDHAVAAPSKIDEAAEMYRRVAHLEGML
ncbi:MAG: hypothetical protein KF795_00590 [Labilithrix sp.]|nr:hypothetical protein [Labilithrix sp.]